MNCAKCHNEKSFLTLNNMNFFDHSVTDFPLKGKHVDVDCKKCHKGSYVKPLIFQLVIIAIKIIIKVNLKLKMMFLQIVIHVIL